MNEESTEILIPKKRFDEVNEKLKALREENKALNRSQSTLTEIRVGLCRGENHAGFKRDFVEGQRFRQKEYEGIVCRISMSQQGRKNRFGEGNRKNQTTGNLGGKNNGNEHKRNRFNS